ncbi:MAG: hypothetical protein ACYDCL_09615 [Myxococcales bacterium]
MNAERMEHLALETSLPLVEVCKGICRALRLPRMAFDAEDKAEWGSCLAEGVEYSASRPYRQGTLREWDSSVPTGCDIGLSVGIEATHPDAVDPTWAVEVLVPSIGQRVADVIGCRVFHHRSWTVVAGSIETPLRVFTPSSEKP